MQGEFENLLLDTQKEYSRSNRMKDKIIIVLIVLMFLEAVIGYCGFVWYESQFDYVTTEQTMLSEEEKKILWLHYKEQKQGETKRENGNKTQQYVLREDFERIVGDLNRQIEGLKEVMPYDATDGKPNVKK